MPTLSFDTGVKEYDVDGRAKLRFNPSDPELYARVLDFVDKSDEIEMRYAALKEVMTGEMDEQGFPVGGVEVVTKIRQLDRELKDTLADIFGHDNDFDAIFDHRSCLAVTDTGRNILNNFFEAIAPIILKSTPSAAGNWRKS